MKRCPSRRMEKLDLSGVERLPCKLSARAILRESASLTRSVQGIGQNGMPHRSEMDANLMGAPGLRLKLEQ